MEIIAELEPTERGRLLRRDRLLERHAARWTPASRSAPCVVRDGRIYFSGGGGIVADSDPEHEYRETLDKAQGIVRALARRRTS